MAIAHLTFWSGELKVNSSLHAHEVNTILV